MSEQISMSSESVVEDNETYYKSVEVLPDISFKRVAIANVVYFGEEESIDWVLIDAGPGLANAIISGAQERFGASPPAAVILTHGHFDHIGALETLLNKWDVPVYAHPLELPYLNGQKSYPEPDPSVGGLMASLSTFFPRGPINITKWLHPLPEDGTVPRMSGWKWLHTPGHTEGHISLWRASDKTLIAGDAIVTTNQESLYAVLTQKPEIHGPPMYFTPDWKSAHESVDMLAHLEPNVVVTGHGPALQGTEMKAALYQLAYDFDTIAVPKKGKYV